VVYAARRIGAASSGGKAPGTPAVPVLVSLDEIVACGNMSPSHLDPFVNESYAMRRHPGKHMGFIFCSQRPQQAHPTIWEMSTELVIFRVATDRQLSVLENYRVPIDKVNTLPYFWHPAARERPRHIPDGASTSRRLQDCFFIHYM